MGRMLCWECLTVADERAKGWCAYRGDVPGDPEPILLFYCPDCVEREVDGAFAARREVMQLVRTLWTVAESTGEPMTGPEGRSRTQTVGGYLRRHLHR